MQSSDARVDKCIAVAEIDSYLEGDVRRDAVPSASACALASASGILAKYASTAVQGQHTVCACQGIVCPGVNSNGHLGTARSTA